MKIKIFIIYVNNNIKKNLIKSFLFKFLLYFGIRLFLTYFFFKLRFIFANQIKI